MVRYLRQSSCRFVIIATIAMVSPVAAETDAARAEGIFSQRAAAGWLRLQLDQRESRQRAGAESPAEASRRQSLEWEEALRYRALLQQQERAIQSSRRQERSRSAASAAVGLPTPPGTSRMEGRLIELRAAQERERLRMRMDRERRNPTRSPWRSGRLGGAE
jgi:hypothetical protein